MCGVTHIVALSKTHFANLRTTDWALLRFVRLEARYHIIEQHHRKYFGDSFFSVLAQSLADVRLCTRVRLQEPPELFIVPCSFS
jgi:hypothetical protein